MSRKVGFRLRHRAEWAGLWPQSELPVLTRSWATVSVPAAKSGPEAPRVRHQHEPRAHESTRALPSTDRLRGGS
jgi:hypothetical protein